jgi:hypothetical protein
MSPRSTPYIGKNTTRSGGLNLFRKQGYVDRSESSRPSEGGSLCVVNPVPDSPKRRSPRSRGLRPDLGSVGSDSRRSRREVTGD